MKTLYIFLTRSGTLLSNLVYSLTGAQYTHVSLAFDEDLSTVSYTHLTLPTIYSV